MKTIKSSLMALGMIAVTLASCSKPENPAEEQKPTPTTKTITLVSDSKASKSAVDASQKDIVWSENETAVYYADGKLIPSDKVNITVNGTTLETTLEVDYNAQSISGFVGQAACAGNEIVDGEEVKGRVITLSPIQNVSPTAFDNSTDAYAMDALDIKDVDLTAPVEVEYKKLTSTCSFQFTGLSDMAEEQISSIKFEAQNSNLAGKFAYDFTSKKYVDAAGSAVEGNLFYEEGVKAITLNYLDEPAFDANFKAWIVSAPITLPKDEKVKVVITTTLNNEISKTFTLAEPVTLSNVNFAEMPLDMTGAEVKKKPIEFPGMTVKVGEDSYSKQIQGPGRINIYLEPMADGADIQCFFQMPDWTREIRWHVMNKKVNLSTSPWSSIVYDGSANTVDVDVTKTNVLSLDLQKSGDYVRVEWLLNGNNELMNNGTAAIIPTWEDDKLKNNEMKGFFIFRATGKDVKIQKYEILPY